METARKTACLHREIIRPTQICPQFLVSVIEIKGVYNLETL